MLSSIFLLWDLSLTRVFGINLNWNVIQELTYGWTEGWADMNVKIAIWIRVKLGADKKWSKYLDFLPFSRTESSWKQVWGSSFAYDLHTPDFSFSWPQISALSNFLDYLPVNIEETSLRVFFHFFSQPDIFLASMFIIQNMKRLPEAKKKSKCYL